MIEGRLPPVIGTFTGGSFHVLNPRPEEVRLMDVAHHLAGIARYTGACNRVWTVGAHCLEVARRVAGGGGTFREQLQGLLHDASEAYLVDIPRPIKPDVYFKRTPSEGVGGALGALYGFDSYYEVEDRVTRVIFDKLDVDYPVSTLVKHCDDTMVLDEVANFFGPGFMWGRYNITEARGNLHPLTLDECKWKFIDRFEQLQYLIDRHERRAS